MFRFEQLEIWELSITYGKKLYKTSLNFPGEEKFALADQLRRSAVSISNNIAEGSGGSPKEFSNFLNIAVRSALETVNILYFARENEYINKELQQNLYQEAEILIKKIRAFKKSLKDFNR
jgi:four helix bundle protein